MDRELLLLNPQASFLEALHLPAPLCCSEDSSSHPGTEGL